MCCAQACVVQCAFHSVCIYCAVCDNTVCVQCVCCLCISLHGRAATLHTSVSCANATVGQSYSEGSLHHKAAALDFIVHCICMQRHFQGGCRWLANAILRRHLWRITGEISRTCTSNGAPPIPDIINSIVIIFYILPGAWTIL